VIYRKKVESNIPEHASMLTIPPDRLGHATHLDPESKDFISSKNIPIEMCMTSNVLCKTVKDYHEHHIRDFLFMNHPLCLCVNDADFFILSIRFIFLYFLLIQLFYLFIIRLMIKVT